MENLSEISCEACRVDAPLLSESELDAMLAHVPEWQVVVVDGIQQVQRDFIFKDFVEAMNFTHSVGAIAEEEGHHPAILLEWGKVRVNWWSHKIRGLHKNDLIMAAKTDSLAR